MRPTPRAAPDGPGGGAARRHRVDTGWWPVALRCLLALAALHALAVLALGIDEPLLGPHSFRQTQTALTAFWLGRGGPFLAYETPVVGGPWSIPFEFPLFQGLVALIGRVGLPLDAAGRATSFAFFLGGLLPLRWLFRSLRLEGPAFPFTAILFLTCPLLLFWSRAFMIESCAVFFGLLWLALVARYTDERSAGVAIAALGAGCLAILVKSTTFVPFAFLGASLVAIRWIRPSARCTARPACVIVAAALGFVPVAVGYGWVVFTDAVKSHNAIGRSLTSEALLRWNFGTLAQKLGRVLWIDTIWDRVLPDTLGFAFLVGLMAIAASVASRRHIAAAGLSLAAFVLPFVVFTNLHVVHDYYQAANAVFLVAAVGIALACIMARGARRLSSVMLVVVVAGQLAMFHARFYPALAIDGSASRLYRIAVMARERTDPAESLVVIGDDWSSLVPYYAQRRSLVLPPWAPDSVLDGLISDPRSSLGGLPLGAIVSCDDRLAAYGRRAPDIAALVGGRPVLAEADGCSLLGARRRAPDPAPGGPGGPEPRNGGRTARAGQ